MDIVDSGQYNNDSGRKYAKIGLDSLEPETCGRVKNSSSPVTMKTINFSAR